MMHRVYPSPSCACGPVPEPFVKKAILSPLLHFCTLSKIIYLSVCVLFLNSLTFMWSISTLLFLIILAL